MVTQLVGPKDQSSGLFIEGTGRGLAWFTVDIFSPPIVYVLETSARLRPRLAKWILLPLFLLGIVASMFL